MKTRFLFILISGLLAVCNTLSQPVISWEKSFGGSMDDKCWRILNCSNGGYLAMGITSSSDGKVTGYHGGLDFWVVRMDNSGNIIWKDCYGGSGDDALTCGIQVSDGGFILAGPSTSNDGQVTGNHGAQDFWVVKIDSSGVLKWQYSYGGSGMDYPNFISPTNDNGFVITGYTNSTDGQVTGNHGGIDVWVIRIDSVGALDWEKTLGGSNTDYANEIWQTSDSGYILCGATLSNDGQVSGNHGGSDFWVVKLQSDLSVQWQTCFGGSSDEWSNSVRPSLYGGYIVLGQTGSSDGQVSVNHGSQDIWVVFMDGNGILQWEKSYGGPNAESPYSIQQLDIGYYVFSGNTYSSGGQVTGNHGSSDYWLVEIDAAGDIIWQRCFGGSSRDEGSDFQQTNDGSFIVSGSSKSTNGQVSGNHGGYDFWIAKLTDTVRIAGIVTDTAGNPVNGGNIYLFSTRNALGGFDTTALSTITNGSYNFTAASDYGYSMLFVPPDIQTLLPTYYGNTVLWMESDSLVSAAIMNPDTIRFIPRPPAMTGSAVIKGEVVTNFFTKANDPIDNVGVVIKRKTRDGLSGYAMTDTDGNFIFENVEVGDYLIYMDYPGIPMYIQNAANEISIINITDTLVLTGKVDSAFVRLSQNVGIQENDLNNDNFKLFPNPSNGRFTVSGRYNNLTPATIIITDLQGRVVYSDEWIPQDSDEKIKTMDLSWLKSGAYILRVHMVNNTLTSLLIIK